MVCCLMGQYFVRPSETGRKTACLPKTKQLSSYYFAMLWLISCNKTTKSTSKWYSTYFIWSRSSLIYEVRNYNLYIVNKTTLTMKPMKLEKALMLYMVLYFIAFISTFLVSIPMLLHVVPKSECLLFVGYSNEHNREFFYGSPGGKKENRTIK